MPYTCAGAAAAAMCWAGTAEREFCVLLPLTNMELAEQIAERVRMHY